MQDLLDPVAPSAPAAPRQRMPDLLDPIAAAIPRTPAPPVSTPTTPITPVSSPTAAPPPRTVAVAPQQPIATQQPDLLSPVHTPHNDQIFQTAERNLRGLNPSPTLADVTQKRLDEGAAITATQPPDPALEPFPGIPGAMRRNPAYNPPAPPEYLHMNKEDFDNEVYTERGAPGTEIGEALKYGPGKPFIDTKDGRYAVRKDVHDLIQTARAARSQPQQSLGQDLKNVLPNIGAGVMRGGAGVIGTAGALIQSAGEPLNAEAYAPSNLDPQGNLKQPTALMRGGQAVSRQGDYLAAGAAKTEEDLPVQGTAGKLLVGAGTLGVDAAMGTLTGGTGFVASFAGRSAGTMYVNARAQGDDEQTAAGKALIAGFTAAVTPQLAHILPPQVGQEIAIQAARAYLGTGGMVAAQATADELTLKAGTTLKVDLSHVFPEAAVQGLIGVAMHGGHSAIGAHQQRAANPGPERLSSDRRAEAPLTRPEDQATPALQAGDYGAGLGRVPDLLSPARPTTPTETPRTQSTTAQLPPGVPPPPEGFVPVGKAEKQPPIPPDSQTREIIPETPQSIPVSPENIHETPKSIHAAPVPPEVQAEFDARQAGDVRRTSADIGGQGIKAKDIGNTVGSMGGGMVEGMYDRMWEDVQKGKIDTRTAPLTEQVVDLAFHRRQITTREEMVALAKEANAVAEAAKGDKAKAVTDWYRSRFPSGTTESAPVPQSGEAVRETATDTSGVGNVEQRAAGEPEIAPETPPKREQSPAVAPDRTRPPTETPQEKGGQSPAATGEGFKENAPNLSKPGEELKGSTEVAPAPKSSAGSGVTAEPPKGDITSIKNAQTAKERTAAGLPERVKPPTQGFDPVWKEAVRRIEADHNASRDLIAKLKANPEMAANQFEQDMVLHRRLELANEVKRLTRERNAAREAGDPVKAEQLGAELATNQEQYKEALEIGERIGTTGGRTLVGRRKYVDTLTYDLAHMIASEEGAKGRKLTAPEREQVEALHKKIEETEAAHAEALAGKDARIAELESQREHAAKVRQKPAVTREPSTSIKYGSKNRLVTRDAYEKAMGEFRSSTFSVGALVAKAIPVATFHLEAGARSFAEFSKRMIVDLGERIKPHLDALYKKAMATVGSDYRERVIEGMKGKLDEDAGADVTRYIGELHKSFIAEQLAKDGKSTRDASLNSVHDAIKDIMPDGWTKSDTRDAMSGRGRTVEMSQDEVSVAKRKERGELLALGHLEGLAKTPPEAPPHTGLQRDKPGTEKRQLDKKVRDEMARLGVNVTDPETQLAGVMDSIKTRLKNEIDDLDLQITTGQRSDDKRTPIEYDAEAKDLKAQRDAKKATLDELFPKKPATPEEQATRALKVAESQAKQAEKRLEAAKAGKFKRPDGTRITGPEIEAMRDRADAANKEAAALRDLDSNIGEDRKVKSLEAQLKALAEGPKNKTPVQETADTKRVAELKSEIERVKAARATPKRTPEEIAIAVRRAAKARAIADYSDRLARGDFAPKTRPDRTETDPGTLRLERIAKLAKQNWLNRKAQIELADRTVLKKATDAVVDTFGTARSIMTSWDFSSVLRQGGVVGLGHPLMMAKSMAAGAKGALSKESAYNTDAAIRNRPNAKNGLDKRAGLYLAEHAESAVEDPKSRLREEMYGSKLLDRLADAQGGKMGTTARVTSLPFRVGAKGVQMSERAFSTQLNSIRASAFDAMAAKLTRTGEPTDLEAKILGNWVNVATGRGATSGPAWDSIMGKAAVAFFSPRYLLSRVQLAIGQPLWTGITEGAAMRARWQVAKEYGRFLAGVAVVYGLGKLAGGVLEDDRRSSDFGKIRFGDYRLDPLTGLGQLLVFSKRMTSGETKTAAGEIKPVSRTDTAYNFIRSKLSPLAGTAVDESGMAFVKDYKGFDGQPMTQGQIVKNLIVPLSFGDIYNAMKSQNVPTGTALAMLAILGMGGQRYETEEKIEHIKRPGAESVRATKETNTGGLFGDSVESAVKKYKAMTPDDRRKHADYMRGKISRASIRQEDKTRLTRELGL